MSPLLPSVDGCALIGMVHLLPLPGSPHWAGDMSEVLDRALTDAEALVFGGCDAIIVENMGDVPYLKGRVEPETTAAMSVLVSRVVDAISCPVGVQVLAAANREALGIAIAAGAGFVRVEGYAYAHVADEGWIDACAGDLMRARYALRANVTVWADIQKKHASHAVTDDLSVAELARGTAFAGADAVIVTGGATGEETNTDDIVSAGDAGVPVVVGSGVTERNAAQMAQHADGLIVGSWLKHGGTWRHQVDVSRVRRLRDAIAEGVRKR